MKIMFLSVIASRSVLVNAIISLSYVLRLRMEIVRPQNADAIAQFYPHDFFTRVPFLKCFLKKSKFLNNKKVRDNAPALRVLARESG